MLKINNLTKRFGGLAAVNNVSIEFDANKINAIIGPNGAGKSTFFNLVAGAMAPTEGSIEYQGMDITGMAALPGWVSRGPSRPPHCSMNPRCWTT